MSGPSVAAKPFTNASHFGVAGGVAGAGADARESGDVLAKSVSGDEAVQVVPAAHVFAGSRQTCALAIDLQQAVVVEGQVVGVDADRTAPSVGRRSTLRRRIRTPAGPREKAADAAACAKPLAWLKVAAAAAFFRKLLRVRRLFMLILTKSFRDYTRHASSVQLPSCLILIPACGINATGAPRSSVKPTLVSCRSSSG